MVRSMKARSIIMDISIDQGGCVETSRPTTLENPTYIEEDVIHYCVPNMSSGIARTASYAYHLCRPAVYQPDRSRAVWHRRCTSNRPWRRA